MSFRGDWSFLRVCPKHISGDSLAVPRDQDKTRPLSTLANLAIIITDVQDMDPIFINLPYSTNIYEHSPPGTTVRIITAIDQDKGRPRGIGYTIVSGNTNSIFALDYISGALTLNGLLDRENPLYSHGFILTVKGTELHDDRTPSDATVTTTFNILVIDINDNAPEFNSSEYSVAITELAQVGFALPLFIQVVDKDESPAGQTCTAPAVSGVAETRTRRQGSGVIADQA
ncbi:cadherin-23-like [Echinops telfairi]|uniref:Cadherin-23-like n=1 Tax=Echinops telfairi TaxID=9371 RepID=A0AC55D798_ECHTE|nr:cadherin-23-like [Echinops telfairi]